MTMQTIRRAFLDHSITFLGGSKAAIFAPRSFSVSNVHRDLKWRLKHGLPANPTSRGTLTDGSDFSYADGRPTPYTNGQRVRIIQQRKHAEKIHECLDLVRHAKMQYALKMQEKQKAVDTILGRKLKPKGKSLAKSEIRST